MGDLGHELWFGCFPTPSAQEAETVVQLARFCDQIGLDLIGIQDHPYQPRFLDTWTLLSALAGETEQIRLVPDVINLPLRPPAVLAKAAASLDILSGGRVELGLGSGAFFDAVVAMGGERRSPGEAVDALEEAIAVIRALWSPTGSRAVNFDGKYYRLRGARPGPVPPHPIGIWLGAYKPRMLRVTGRLADGWIPSAGYAPPSELGEMTRTIDEAAVEAGREPAAIRRVYNIVGQFLPSEQGFLQGPPRIWIEQLTELVLQHGMSVFVLGPGQDAEGDLRRFAEEVAPGLREAVAKAREEAISRGFEPQAATEVAAQPPTPIPATGSGTARVPAATPPRSGPTPHAAALNEEGRPHLAQDAEAPVTPMGRESQETLIQVHEHLRRELRELQEIVAQVVAGAVDPAAARSLLNRMAMRQNYWTLGAFCAQYCRVVSIHHTLEDYQMFPALRRGDESLKPVLDKLREEHEVIAEQIDHVDRALVEMMNDPARLNQVRRVADELAEMLLSHLAYEEDELLGALGRLELLV